jgi:hypothetical protein
VTDIELARRLESFDDDKLVEMLTTHAADYRAEVLTLARVEARRRGLSLEPVIPEPAPPPPQPQRGDMYAAGGRWIVCGHCGSNRFDARSVVLSNRGAALVDMEWTSPGATALVCTVCTRIEWFTQPVIQQR